MTITLGWWLLPVAVTVGVGVFAFTGKHEDQGNLVDAALYGLVLWVMRVLLLIPVLLAWMIYFALT